MNSPLNPNQASPASSVTGTTPSPSMAPFSPAGAAPQFGGKQRKQQQGKRPPFQADASKAPTSPAK